MDHHPRDTAAISALHLLHSYNQILQPPGLHYNGYSTTGPSPIPKEPPKSPTGVLTAIDFSPVLGAFQPYATALQFRGENLQDCKARRIYMNVNPLLVSNQSFSRRTRGEKKAIPDEQKDDKYFERRKRNNQAAKKSRDARKIREDQVALKATFLEHENAMLRAQLLTMREETQALRRLLLLYRKPESCLVPEDAKDSVVPLSAASHVCHVGRIGKEGFE